MSERPYAEWAHLLGGAGAAFTAVWLVRLLGTVSADTLIDRVGPCGPVLVVVALVLAYVADSIRGQGGE